jgi:hypothetical protein
MKPYCGLRIFGMALSNQSDIPGFFIPLKVYKFLSIPAYDKPEPHVPRRWLYAAGFIKSSFEILACRELGFGESR